MNNTESQKSVILLPPIALKYYFVTVMLVKSNGRAIVEYQFIKCLSFPCASLSGPSDISFFFMHLYF